MTHMRSAILEYQFVGDGYYDLCLRIDELIQLQEKLGCGPNVVATRLLQGEWLIQDIKEVVRLGLIGGGMRNEEALGLVGRTIREGYLMEYSGLAGNLLYAALAGVEDEPLPGEADAPPTK